MEDKLLCKHERRYASREDMNSIGGTYYLYENREISNGEIKVPASTSESFIVRYDRKEYSSSVGGMTYTWS